MIIGTILDLPNIAPDSWEIFWDLWNSYSKPMVKVKKTVNQEESVGDQDLWRGIEIYRKSFNLSYSLPFVDIKPFLPLMYDQLKSLDITGIQTIRLIQSLRDVGAHSDNRKDEWNIRYMFYCQDPTNQWYYTPIDDKQNRKFLKLPDQSKWFSYNDKYCLHGSVFKPDHPKILLQIYCESNPELIEKGIKKYPEYVIEI